MALPTLWDCSLLLSATEPLADVLRVDDDPICLATLPPELLVEEDDSLTDEDLCEEELLTDEEDLSEDDPLTDDEPLTGDELLTDDEPLTDDAPEPLRLSS